ncbi:S8 family serine peptidase [Virgibacillus natechei]|nr:S8 family serine peptidase [Virgibacillus natechei]
MESLEFIKGIHAVQTYEAIETTSTIQADAEVDQVLPSALNNTSYTGKGVKVGVVDTGIDYNHPDLEGNYQGGYDLVDLDNDPMETTPDQGIPTVHGTHVAGIIAANGELQGVAPDAEIHAYRALGPGGSGTSIQVIAAMEQAVEDGMDVMNLSLGNAVNGPDYPTSKAVNRAADLGISVVLANGNDGPENWTVGSPATASNALSIGASSSPQRIPFLYDAQADKAIQLVPMMGAPPWDLETAYQIVNGVEKEANFHGKIVLLERDDVPLYDKAKQAEDKGAIAVLIANNEEGLFEGMVEHENYPLQVPVAAITNEDGKWLHEQIQKESLQLETAYEETESGVAEFSSRGPVTVNWDIKPDLLAPGTNIVSTVPDGYQQLQGTSMAAPHVAGAVALLKEAKPNWTNEQIFGALKTTALRMETEESYPSEPIMQGMGGIQPQEAIDTTTIITDPLLSFGKITSHKEAKTIEVEIENTTNQQQTYSFEIPKKEQGLTWNLPQTFTVDENETKTIPIEVSMNTTQINEGIHQGWLTLNQSDQSFHLPYLFVNQTADNPKATGFEFALKPFSDDTFLYSLYVTEPAEQVQVDLYDPDTLMFKANLLQTDDLAVGMNEGELEESEVADPGHYLAQVTVQLEDGRYESYQTNLYIEITE